MGATGLPLNAVSIEAMLWEYECNWSTYNDVSIEAMTGGGGEIISLDLSAACGSHSELCNELQVTVYKSNSATHCS